MNPPAAGLVLGRSVLSSGGNTFSRNHISGYFTAAALYNVGDECDTFYASQYVNKYDGACAIHIGSNDPANLVPIDAGQLTGWFHGCSIWQQSDTGNCVDINGTVVNHTWRDCYMVVPNGGNCFEAKGIGGQYIYQLTFDSIRIEPHVGTGHDGDTRFLKVSAVQGVGKSNFNNIEHTSTAADYFIETADGDFSDNTINNCPFGTKLIKLAVGSEFLRNTIFHRGANQIYVDPAMTNYDNHLVWAGADYPYENGGNYNKQVIYSRPSVALTFADGDATPSVKHSGNVFKTANTNPTTITNFHDGYDGQEIWVKICDALTTIGFHGTNIIGNGGVDKACDANDAIHAVCIDNYWFTDFIDYA